MSDVGQRNMHIRTEFCLHYPLWDIGNFLTSASASERPLRLSSPTVCQCESLGAYQAIAALPGPLQEELLSAPVPGTGELSSQTCPGSRDESPVHPHPPVPFSKETP